MDAGVRLDPFNLHFARHASPDGPARLTRRPDAPSTVPDPDTGRHLQIATVDVGALAICPECRSRGEGGFVSFVSDLRMVYACPECRRLVWVPGA
jgi:hypothetical protein